MLKIVLIFVLILLGNSLTPVSFAQELPDLNNEAETVLTSPAGSLPLLDSNSIPSEKVSQFVQAYLQVLALIDQRQGELLSAETELESQRLEREIEGEAEGIIQKAGLTKQEYLQLLSLANIDPEFGERIAAGLQEAKN